MSEQRLSKLQKTILECIKEKSTKQHNWILYSFLYDDVRKKMLIAHDWVKETKDPKVCAILSSLGTSREIYYDWSLKSSFSRSIRNLAKKGLISLDTQHCISYYSSSGFDESKDVWYSGVKVETLSITDNGLLLISDINIKEKP